VTSSEHAERFTHLRPLLFTIVYEILGSATESDDVLQDSYLRWAQVDLATVRDTKSYLAQLVTRQALNALRASARRREDYIGPWLPEPLLLDDRDGAADVVLAESVSMASGTPRDAQPGRAGGVRAARGVRLRLRRDRRRGRQVRGDGAPGRASRQ
jgi:DNA-directed RNA polymerase specialized sigma24 family protein